MKRRPYQNECRDVSVGAISRQISILPLVVEDVPNITESYSRLHGESRPLNDKDHRKELNNIAWYRGAHPLVLFYSLDEFI